MNIQKIIIFILVTLLCDINYAYYILNTSYINNFTNNTNNIYNIYNTNNTYITNNTNISNHLYSNDNKKSLIIIIIFVSGVISGICEYY